MSEEVKIKISQPMFEVGELERFDNNIHNIVEEYSKLMFKEKDQILTQRIIMKQEEEIKRLKYIIKESIEYLQIVYDYLLVDKTFIDDDLKQKQKEIKDLMKILKSGDE